MKKTYLIFGSIFLLAFITMACESDNHQPEPNFITAKLNNEDWNGIPEIKLRKRYFNNIRYRI